MKTTIDMHFEVELEEKDREKFQREGHMLFALNSPGETPDAPLIRRQWEGESVWIAMLIIGTLRLRVMDDSEQRVIEAMREMINNTFHANAREAASSQFNYQQFLSLNEDWNALSGFLQKQYGGAWRDWLDHRANLSVGNK
jgi:hypothetical protein